jgi:hypothetical protein
MICAVVAALLFPVATGIAFFSVCMAAAPARLDSGGVLRAIGSGLVAALVVGCLFGMLAFVLLKPPVTR